MKRKIVASAFIINYRNFVLTAFTAFALAGCIPAEQSVAPAKLVIPPPPNEPRLEFIGAFKGDSNFQETSKLDMFLGEELNTGGKNIARPYGVSGKDKKIYVTDAALGLGLVIDIPNKKVWSFGESGPGKLASPIEVAVDRSSNIYVSDTKQKRVYRYTADGNFSGAYGENDEFYRPTGVAVDDDNGLLYVVDTSAHDIKVFSLKQIGKSIRTIGKRGNGDGEFNYPTNISIDRRNGNIVVGDTQNFRIQIFDKNGVFLSKFGSVGDRPGYFARPKGVGIDSEGHIYAADAAFNNIQVFSDKGEFLMFFGGTGNGPGTFQLPASIEFDEDDRMYISEIMNGRVQVFQYLSEKWKKNNPAAYKKIIEDHK